MTWRVIRNAPVKNPKEAAKYLLEKWGMRVAHRTLANKRWSGGGPRFYRAGRQILYGDDHLDEYAIEVLGQPLSSTSDRGA
jgi:hypothetical protein